MSITKISSFLLPNQYICTVMVNQTRKLRVVRSGRVHGLVDADLKDTCPDLLCTNEFTEEQ